MKKAVDRDMHDLVAVKGRRRIYAKPLKPGEEWQKTEKTGDLKR